MHRLNKKNKRGWLVLELLLTTALAVIVGGAGMIAMYQILGMGGGLYPVNQLQQVELSRILLSIENDFANASRAYVWDRKILKSSAELTTGTHSVTVLSGDAETWPVAIAPNDEATFLTNWQAADGTISATAADSNNKYYTLLFLGAGQKINAVVYMTITQSVSGIKYTTTRYENDGTNLVQSNNLVYNAPGASFTASDQSATTTTLPSITESGSIYCGIVIRFPSSFSTALKDIGTGNQARRVKYTADAWGTWTFVPAEIGRWVKQ